MTDLKRETEALAARARAASRNLATLPTTVKDQALRAMADAIRAGRPRLEEANAKDVAGARAAGLSQAMIDRLVLNSDRIEGMAEGLTVVAGLPDPVGETTRAWTRPNGLQIARVRVPIGVVGIIYESRPNVTADTAGLCLKSGNAIILRGGKEALHSNGAIAAILAEAAAGEGVPEGAIQIVPWTDRAVVGHLLKLDRLIDVIIPRGGEGLVRMVTEESTIPVIQHYQGICHVFVDKDADLEMAERICLNAKVQRPSVCNAMETLLVHADVAEKFLPGMIAKFLDAGVEIRGCEETRALMPDVGAAAEEDWKAEYVDLILSVRVVPSLDAAIDHIAAHGSAHTDSIVTNSYQAARRFTHAVDSATVMVNASTRFSDGFEFGFGAEIGISTSKLHARGPMGLEELTSYKYVILGDGQVRE
ncbi:MAG: glutamate-5-semialdehyde dehydrogenase [Myxococcota bacterium]